MKMKKSVDEMIRSKTPDEWRKLILDGMKELGLWFRNKEEGEGYTSLFSEEGDVMEQFEKRKQE